jgi:hypothetical protein
MSWSMSYWDLIKCLYFADTTERGVKRGPKTGWRQGYFTDIFIAYFFLLKAKDEHKIIDVPCLLENQKSCPSRATSIYPKSHTTPHNHIFTICLHNTSWRKHQPISDLAHQKSTSCYPQALLQILSSPIQEISLLVGTSHLLSIIEHHWRNPQTSMMQKGNFVNVFWRKFFFGIRVLEMFCFTYTYPNQYGERRKSIHITCL